MYLSVDTHIRMVLSFLCCSSLFLKKPWSKHKKERERERNNFTKQNQPQYKNMIFIKKKIKENNKLSG